MPGPLEPIHSSGADALQMTPLDDGDFDAVEQTVRHAAGALTGLTDILGRLETSIARAVDQRRTEEQFGQLFVRAQAYVDDAIGHAEERARRLIADAEFEASQIVSSARDEAKRLLADSAHGAMPGDAAHQLKMTIESFGQVNQELIHELTALSEALLAPSRATATAMPETPYEHGRHAAAASTAASVVDTPLAADAHGAAEPMAATGYWSKLRPPPAATRVRRTHRGTPARPPSW